ncbi:MAG: hypothetical protein GXP32_03115 [Kiritimatiellaeota bacterium]|nr:hypothetical protein [Kiritimatiellota bacterium]
MRKSMMMSAMMVVFLFTMGSVFGQFRGGKRKAVAKEKPMQCPIKKGMSKTDIQKMMANCPMMKGKTAAERKAMMSKCSMMKYMMSTNKNKKPLTKERMAKMMSKCPMMKNMSDADKKKMMSKCMTMMSGKMKNCPMKNQSNADKSDLKSQTNCPVMGGKINKKFYADVKGKRVYVCCPGCISKVEADPDKYVKKLQDAGTKLEAPK